MALATLLLAACDADPAASAPGGATPSARASATTATPTPSPGDPAEAVLRGVYMASTMNAARAAVLGIKSLKVRPLTVNSLQEHAKVLPPQA